MVALSVFQQQRQEVELHGAVPVEKLGVAVIFLQFLTLHRVGTYDLTLEVVIACGVLRIHKRRCGVCLNGILEHAPVGLVAVDDTRCHVGGEGEQSALGGVHHRSTRTTLGAEVDTVGVAIVYTHAIVALCVATAHREGVLGGETCAAHTIEPVVVAAEVNAGVAPSETHVTIFVGVHHLKLVLDHVP